MTTTFKMMKINRLEKKKGTYMERCNDMVACDLIVCGTLRRLESIPESRVTNRNND